MFLNKCKNIILCINKNLKTKVYIFEVVYIFKSHNWRLLVHSLYVDFVFFRNDHEYITLDAEKPYYIIIFLYVYEKNSKN